MRPSQMVLRLLPVAVVLLVVSLLPATPATAQCYGSAYGGFSGHLYAPAYDYSLRSGSWDYGYPYYHGYGAYYRTYRPYYRSYPYGYYGRGYRSYYGGGFGYGAGGCY